MIKTLKLILIRLLVDSHRWFWVYVNYYEILNGDVFMYFIKSILFYISYEVHFKCK